MEKTTIVLFIVTLFTLGCSESPTTYELDQVVYNPMDAHLDGDILQVLYGDQGKVGQGFVAQFTWVDDAWELEERIYADLPDGLRFAHSMNPVPAGWLISDSANSQVVEIDFDGAVIWNSADLGIVMEYPNDAELSPDGFYFLICDNSEGKQRVIEVEIATGEIVWEHATSEETHDADYLDNGHVMYVRSLSKTVEEVSRDHELIWKHQINDDWPRSAERLENDNTLIASNTAIFEIAPDHQENKIIGELEELYNIHLTSQGILATTWKAVLMIEMDGSILWNLQLPIEDLQGAPIISPDKRRMLSIQSFHKLKTIGYVN